LLVSFSCPSALRWREMLTFGLLDRTLKGIGVLNASPVYESLPGFERYGTLTLHTAKIRQKC
jgi:hypothetical protein